MFDEDPVLNSYASDIHQKPGLLNYGSFSETPPGYPNG